LATKDILENTKSGFDLIRNLAIVALIVIFLAWPQLINRAFTGLGIEEFDLWGFKGKTSLTHVAQDLAFQLQVNARLTAALKRLDPHNEVISAAEAAQANAGQTLAANAAQIGAAQQATASSGSWAVVFGADTTADAAKQEIDRAQAKKFEEVKLYLRQDWYLSVIEFPTREAAIAALPQIKNLSRYSGGAYIVNLSNWCPSSTQGSDNVLVCK
jgi:hypothetical protein